MFLPEALVIGTPGDYLAVQTGNGVVIERSSQRAGGIDLAGDIIYRLGRHHTSPILLRQPLGPGRDNISHRQHGSCLVQGLAQVTGNVAAALHSDAHATEIAAVQRPRSARLDAEEDAQGRKGGRVTAAAGLRQTDNVRGLLPHQQHIFDSCPDILASNILAAQRVHKAAHGA